MAHPPIFNICPLCRSGATREVQQCTTCGEVLRAATAQGTAALQGMLVGGRYELAELIGEGTTGWVFRAIHKTLGSSVALKIMKPHVEDGDILHRRFQREARVASRLHHPHIIQFVDFGILPVGVAYIVSEYLEGESLRTLIEQEEALGVERAVELVRQVLSALDEAHAQSVIHRDLKADNIMLVRMRGGDDFVKVLDFGIAKLLADVSMALTQQGQLLGTPAIMAPELIRGTPATVATDLYAVGVLLHELLCGQTVYDTMDIMEMLAQHLHTVPIPPSVRAPEVGVSPELDAIVAKALAKDPADRYPSAEAFGAALVELQGEPEVVPPNHVTPPALPNVQTSGGQPTHLQLVPPPSSATEDDERAGPVAVRRSIVGCLPLPMAFRPAEFGMIRNFLEGPDPAALICAPACTGRSRLLRELSSEADDDRIVLRTGADPTLGRRPWYPVRCLLAGALELDSIDPDVGALREVLRARGTSEHEATALARIFGLDAEHNITNEAVNPAVVHAAMAKVLLRGDPTVPSVLLFDDIEHYDPASRECVGALLGGVGETSHKLVVVSSRDLTDTAVPMTPIRPRPLGLDQIEQLLPPTLRDEPDVAASVAATSEGNLLHTHLLLLHHDLSHSWQEIPLGELIHKRVVALPAPTVPLVQAISTFGQIATWSQLQALTDADAVPSETLERMVLSGLVVETPLNSLMLIHPTIADAVRSQTPVELASRFGRLAFEHESRVGGGGDPWLLAAYAEAAGDWSSAMAQRLAAAKQAELRLAPQEAREQRERAQQIRSTHLDR